ncbi:hypothetical protein PC128_g25519 [Phytophthora cactorum]|nr:hypothetical protein PC120_g22109 [Phytophthora cactorum]KAG3046458.1 hypothetical protein PC121_g20655 [Phytophthora cactorum]KAG3138699.1 hypothetical protein PC128_g25519 [Phytophthora cactorum]KAG4038201.1 hypothetical protein PC123_g26235 [Phytophthora cactorum]
MKEALHDERRGLRGDASNFFHGVEAPTNKQTLETTRRGRLEAASPPTCTQLRFEEDTPHGYGTRDVWRARYVDGNAQSEPVNAALESTARKRTPTPVRDTPRKRTATPAGERKRTPKKPRSTPRIRDRRTPARMRSGRRESFEEEDTVPLLDTVSPEKAAELQKVLYPMFKQRKPEH